MQKLTRSVFQFHFSAAESIRYPERHASYPVSKPSVTLKWSRPHYVLVGRFAIEGVARNVGRNDLWAWYTDFGPPDVEIVNREVPDPRARMTRRDAVCEGQALHVEQTMELRGRPYPMHLDITLHPDRFAYDAVVLTRDPRGRPLLKESRHYMFSEIPEGTKVHADVAIQETHGPMKLLSAVGITTRMLRQGSQRFMDGLLRAAEKELGKKSS